MGWLLLLLIGLVFADVPAGCAQKYPKSTLAKIYEFASLTRNDRSDKLQGEWQNFLQEQGGTKFGLTCEEYLPVIKAYNITTFDISWQHVLNQEFAPYLYSTSQGILHLLEYILQTHLRFNTKLALIQSWLSVYTSTTMVDPNEVPGFFHTLKTVEPWKDVFEHNHEFLDRLEKAVKFRPCIKPNSTFI